MVAQRVLVVDDEPMVRQVLSRYLSRDRFDVATAADGEEALVRFGEAEPDLVLLDLMLPRIDGYEVFRQLRDRAPTPIILLTARGEETDRIVGLERAPTTTSPSHFPRERWSHACAPCFVAPVRTARRLRCSSWAGSESTPSDARCAWTESPSRSPARSSTS